MFELFEKTAETCSKVTTNTYSTSFSLGIKMIAKDYRWAIYGIYGFVRLADEIVDTFDRDDKSELLANFKQDTYEAIQKGISLNPILHSFQKVANMYNIGKDLIEPFFNSMEADLEQKKFDSTQYSEYIYGSAEVVGLMCLKVFCDGNDLEYQHLREPARSLGAAFQKVNFLRDIKSDIEDRGRIYFPALDLTHFNEQTKLAIIDDVRKDFKNAYKGILQLPISCRFGVYTSYIYYLKLLEKIERKNAREVLESRIRVANSEKMALLAKSFFKFKFNVL
ncbi:MAG: phytoene/squalene synthase family protein [Bacteroidia bacterium]|nr:phytoene/squalene synthase family protein [Bacteroidia bacterium]